MVNNEVCDTCGKVIRYRLNIRKHIPQPQCPEVGCQRQFKLRIRTYVARRFAKRLDGGGRSHGKHRNSSGNTESLFIVGQVSHCFLPDVQLYSNALCTTTLKPPMSLLLLPISNGIVQKSGNRRGLLEVYGIFKQLRLPYGLWAYQRDTVATH